MSVRERAERLMRGGAPRGYADALLAGGLRAAVPFYRAGLWWRNRGWEAGRGVAPVPEGAVVVSVGNLTLGGSGKTPLTIALAQALAAEGRRVAIVLRGYGGAASAGETPRVVARRDEARGAALVAPESVAAAGDEATLYAMRVQEAAVVVARRRAAGVALAAGAPSSGGLGCDTILLDDGFQHRAQARTADLLILDASLPRPAYTLFPRGYLREPMAAATRATAIVSTAASDLDALLDAKWLGYDIPPATPILRYERALGGAWRVGAAEDAPWAAAGTADELRPLLRGTRVWWFAGIAHPERFAMGIMGMMGSMGSTGIVGSMGTMARQPSVDQISPMIPMPPIVPSSPTAPTLPGRALSDHEPYSDATIGALVAEARAARADIVLTTEKDAVKLLGRWPATASANPAPRLFALRLDVSLVDSPAWVAHCLGPRAKTQPEPEMSIRFSPAA